ncbi:hypothetical protein ISG34_04380 [Methanothermobacter marburgensis]|uniref:Uncharacterized protein n=1 Tax=Methanothermobacter marburgensis (strain ATCC BAA-927 / DSM 2133 / JCM 14651 / NBRC 100331 / OCM 82 / Marburg) TaxID=79929 RepID=D9PW84_METTM|nr:hypothetical protein [Methanothermobacter marburgensis]ADL58482.1 conserved hypothetical protein [Methanothermobacter marburgensis str. Marburg]WBF10607.1 hypothetical protein ISG34_04380 [Methanothermobacter marburgensis]
MLKKGFDRYSTFGLREEWLIDYLIYGEDWIKSESNLGPIQRKAVINWLLDANLLSSKDLSQDLLEIYFLNPDFTFFVLWINLYYGSPIVNFFCDFIQFNVKVTKKEVLNLVLENGNLGRKSAMNSVSALFNLFRHSRLRKLVSIEMKGNYVRHIIRKTVNVESYMVGYSLYKLAEYLETSRISFEELYDKGCPGGPYKLFGISKKNLINHLKILEELKIISNFNEDFVELKELESKNILKFYLKSLKNHEKIKLRKYETEIKEKLIKNMYKRPSAILRNKTEFKNLFKNSTNRDVNLILLDFKNITLIEKQLQNFKFNNQNINIVLFLSINKEDVILLNDKAKKLFNYKNLVSIVPCEHFKEFELFLNNKTRGFTLKNEEYHEKADQIVSLWIIDMLHSGFFWHINGESGYCNKLLHISKMINNDFSRRIFPLGPENITNIRKNRNLWKNGNYPKISEIFLLSENLNEFKSKTKKGIISYLSYLLRDSNGNWIVDDDLRFMENIYHPVKTMIEVAVERVSKRGAINEKDLIFLAKPPYGLKGDMIGHAIVSFILRTLKGYLLINGKVVSDDELKKFKKKIIDAWDSS